MPALEIYDGREQTLAKHFILERYLQALAFKLLRSADLAYVDGFSGPWRAKGADFSDTSFMIALRVLRDAQTKVAESIGRQPRVRCFFSEADPHAYGKLAAAIMPHHRPSERFEIRAFQGEFEDAVGEILAFAGNAFRLVFIDPTGWTGYPLDKIRPLLHGRGAEVLVNFMFDHISRFASDDRSGIVASLDPILGPGWRDRLDPSLPPGPASEKLFRENLKAAGGFRHIVATRINKPTSDRPQFSIVYGTKSVAGLKTFREAEHGALRMHAGNRVRAKARKVTEESGQLNLLTDQEVNLQAASIDDLVEAQKTLARQFLIDRLAAQGPLTFEGVVAALLEPFMLRETNVKDICLELVSAGAIENTWGERTRKRKPHDGDIIKLRGMSGAGN